MKSLDIKLLVIALVISLSFNVYQSYTERYSVSDAENRLEFISQYYGVSLKGFTITRDMTINEALDRCNRSMICPVIRSYGLDYICYGKNEELVSIAVNSMFMNTNGTFEVN